MAMKPSLDDARHLLELFEAQGLTRQQMTQLRGCGVLADVCAAAKAGLLAQYDTWQAVVVQRALGLLPDLSVPTVWRRIKLGTGIASGAGFYQKLTEVGIHVDDAARDIMKHSSFTVATKAVKVGLVKPLVGDLGFVRGASLDDICARAVEMRLELCPLEVGPQLRLQYLDQPLHEQLVIAMKTFNIQDYIRGCCVVVPSVFTVHHDYNGRWLGVYRGKQPVFLSARTQLVFCSARDSAQAANEHTLAG